MSKFGRSAPSQARIFLHVIGLLYARWRDLLYCPVDLVYHFWGPMEGRRHDAAMLRESRLVSFLDQEGAAFDDRYIYGDPAYGVSHRILSGFKGNLTTTKKKEFNRRMSSVRESVEWTFALLKSLWKFIDYKKQQKILHSPVAQVVAVAMLLTNCHTCYNRCNQISMYFWLTPPTLVAYLTSATAPSHP